ncbi:MAG: hypothetical protein WKF28_11060 [Rubrobacteraceae bacterium]
MSDRVRNSSYTKGRKDPLPPQTILGSIPPYGSYDYEQLTVMVERKPTREQLLEIANELHKKHRVEKIEFIDNQAFLASNPTLGRWSIDEKSQVKEKDWSKQPSEQDIVLWEDFQQDTADLFDSDEDKSIKSVAKKHGLGKKETKAAIDKVRDWIAN